MKKLILHLLCPAFALSLMAGCVEPEPKDANPDFCQGTSCEQAPSAELTGVFVAGHLGNYRDCPEDAWTDDTVVGAGDSGAPLEGDAAACAPGEECTPILNCETAQATFNLSNVGDAIATGVQVDRIELHNDAGVLVAELPVVEVIATAGTFDGTLAEGDTITLRVDFQGPLNPYQLLVTDSADGDSRFAATGSGTLRIVVSADDHGELGIEGKEIYAVPSVDT